MRPRWRSSKISAMSSSSMDNLLLWDSKVSRLVNREQCKYVPLGIDVQFEGLLDSCAGKLLFAVQKVFVEAVIKLFAAPYCEGFRYWLPRKLAYDVGCYMQPKYRG